MTLNLSSNNLKGTIPSSLGQLNNLEMLDLFSNQLSGINQTTSMPRSLDYCEMEKNMFNAQFQATKCQAECT
jgi:Leucine-rich repeat (LRR) protein